MREPRRSTVRACKQIVRQQWWPQDAKLVSEHPANLPLPAKAMGTGTGSGKLLLQSFSDEEEELLIKLHALLGNRWSLIAGRLPGRTGEEVKSHWETQMRRKLRRMGINPENHRVQLQALLVSHNHGQRRCAPDECEDADSGNQARKEHRLAELNLELTLSTPSICFGDQENLTDPAAISRGFDLSVVSNQSLLIERPSVSVYFGP